MEEKKIVLTARERLGTRAAKSARSNGLVPCVLYGKGLETQSLLANARDIEKLALKRARVTAVKHPKGENQVLIKRVEYDHLGEKILHVDFQKIEMTQTIEVDVPLIFKGKPVGVLEEGGVFEEHIKAVRVLCTPDAIPEKIEVDISGLKLGQKLRIKDLPLPLSSKATQSPELAVALVHAPRVVEVAPATVAEAATPTPTEPEVIKKPKKEEVPAEGAAKEPKK